MRNMRGSLIVYNAFYAIINLENTDPETTYCHPAKELFEDTEIN